MTNNQAQKLYYYGILKSTNRHGFSENPGDLRDGFKTLTAAEMADLIRQEPFKHIEWDDAGNPVAVEYNAQYWGDYEEDRLVRFAGYRFSENCVRLNEKPIWDE